MIIVCCGDAECIWTRQDVLNSIDRRKPKYHLFANHTSIASDEPLFPVPSGLAFHRVSRLQDLVGYLFCQHGSCKYPAYLQLLQSLNVSAALRPLCT